MRVITSIALLASTFSFITAGIGVDEPKANFSLINNSKTSYYIALHDRPRSPRDLLDKQRNLLESRKKLSPGTTISHMIEEIEKRYLLIFYDKPYAEIPHSIWSFIPGIKTTYLEITNKGKLAPMQKKLFGKVTTPLPLAEKTNVQAKTIQYKERLLNSIVFPFELTNTTRETLYFVPLPAERELKSTDTKLRLAPNESHTRLLYSRNLRDIYLFKQSEDKPISTWRFTPGLETSYLEINEAGEETKILRIRPQAGTRINNRLQSHEERQFLERTNVKKINGKFYFR